MYKNLKTVALTALVITLFLWAPLAEAQTVVDDVFPDEITSIELIDGKAIEIRKTEMGMAANFIKSIYEELHKAVFQHILKNISSIVQSLIYMFTLLWLVFHGLRSYFGHPLDPYNLGKQIFVLLVIYSFVAADTAVLAEWTYNPLMAAFYGFAGWMLDQASTSGILGGANIIEITIPSEKIYHAINVIEARIEDVFTFGSVLYDELSDGRLNFSGAIKGAIMALGLFVVFGFLLGYFTFLFAYSLFALHVYYIFMPIMLCFFAFDTTRPTFKQWIRSVFNYLTIPVIAAAAMAITMSIMSSNLAEVRDILLNQGDVDISQFIKIYIKLMFIGFLSLLIHLRSADMAAHLTGGASGGLGADFMRTINTMANMATAGAATVLAAPKVAASATSSTVKGVQAGVDTFSRFKGK